MGDLEHAHDLRNTCAVTTQGEETPAPTHWPVDPNKDTLEHPPLELVVCQVRHEPVASVADASLLPMFQQRLGHRFDRIEPLTGISQGLPAGMIASGAVAPTGWRLTNENGWIVSLSPDSYSLECTKYTRWSTFRDLIGSLTSLVWETYSPRLTQRVGLRYVDRIDRPGTVLPAQWVGLLHPAMIGFGSDDVLKDATLVTQVVSELLIDGFRANLRGSIARDNTPAGYSFLLDTDCFDERSGAFDPELVGATIGRLHELNLRLFQHTITPALYKEIHG